MIKNDNKKKFKDKTFAAGCDREIIREIEHIMPLTEFFELSINALKEIKQDIDLHNIDINNTSRVYFDFIKNTLD